MSSFDAMTSAVVRLKDEFFPRVSLRRRLARGTFWTLAGTGAMQLGGIAAAIATARVLGQTGFGELAMVRSTVLMFGVLAGTGLGMAATKYVAEYRDTDPARAGRLIGLLLNVATGCGGTVTLLGFLLASPLALWVMGAEQLEDPLRAGCLLILINAVNGVQVGTLSGFEAFRMTARISILDALFNLMFMVLGGWLFGVTGAVGGCVLAAAVTFPIKNSAMRHECHRTGVIITRRGVGSELSALWSLALPSILVGVVVQPFEWLARLALTRQKDGFAQLGVFAAAYSWGQVVLLLPSQVTGPSLAILASLFTSREKSPVGKLVKTLSLVTVGLGLAAGVPLMLLSKPIMASYGRDFATAWDVLPIVLAAYIIATLSGLFRSVLAAAGYMWWQVAHSLIWSIVLLGTFALLGGEGARALSLSYLVAFAVVIFTQGSSAIAALWRVTSKPTGSSNENR